MGFIIVNTARGGRGRVPCGDPYGVLRALFPNGGKLSGGLDSYVAAIVDGDAKTRGLALGSEVAAGIVALPANDGRTLTSSSDGSSSIGQVSMGVRTKERKSALANFVAPPRASAIGRGCVETRRDDGA
jgi:hypothetical protein